MSPNDNAAGWSRALESAAQLLKEAAQLYAKRPGIVEQAHLERVALAYTATAARHAVAERLNWIVAPTVETLPPEVYVSCLPDCRHP